MSCGSVNILFFYFTIVPLETPLCRQPYFIIILIIISIIIIITIVVETGKA